MKKLIVAMIAGTFAAGVALAQQAVTPTVPERPAAKDAPPTSATKAAKKPMTKEEKKAAFAASHAEMQKQSGMKTATPYKKKPKPAKAEKETSSDTSKGTPPGK